VAALRGAVQRYFPAADGPLLRHSACMFTNTPDGHFIIDRHPAEPQARPRATDPSMA
jgi:sarcosine oxidase